MTGAPATPHPQAPLAPDRLAQGWLAIPCWVGSFAVHGCLALLIIAIAQLPSCRRDYSGEGGESFREVGIRVMDANPADSPVADRPNVLQESPQASSSTTTSPAPPSDLPPVPLQLPTFAVPTPIIGGGLPTAQMPSAADSLIKPTNLPQPGAPGGATGESPNAANGGATSFLGIKDQGRRFVYVIDRSFSMADDHALEAAKMELLASLQRLNETQQFQIIFYNNEFVVLAPRGGRFEVFRGTDAQRLLVTEQIREITPAAGTRHLPALLEALQYNPDVIFLLTDGAAESALSTKELELVKRQNRHGSRIHCIEFGRGPKSHLGEAGNFLKVLARENDGQYLYRNLKAGF